MNEKTLIENGYVKHFSNTSNTKYKFILQKTFRDNENKVKYFIDVRFYDFSEFNINDAWEVVTRMYLIDANTNNPRQVINTIVCQPGDTVEIVEKFVDNIYCLLGCIPDIHNNS